MLHIPHARYYTQISQHEIDEKLSDTQYWLVIGLELLHEVLDHVSIWVKVCHINSPYLLGIPLNLNVIPRSINLGKHGTPVSYPCGSFLFFLIFSKMAMI